MKRFINLLIFLLLLILLFLMPLLSDLIKEAVISGVSICINTIIPSLFPFLFFSSMLSAYGGDLLSKIFAPVVCPIFKISEPSCRAFILGILGGFPTGAHCAAELYREKKISKEEAERLPIFSNNAGLMFTVGTIGAGHFSSFKAGLLLYFFHIFASVVAGIMTRSNNTHLPFNCSEKNLSLTAPLTKVPYLFSKCVTKSIVTMALICGNFIIFRVISKILSLFLPNGIITNFITGLFEVTGGILSMPKTGYGLALSAFLLSFNGLCVHMQAISAFAPLGLSFKKCILWKTLSAFYSAILMYIAFPNDILLKQSFPPMLFYVMALIIPSVVFIFIRKKQPVINI